MQIAASTSPAANSAAVSFWTPARIRSTASPRGRSAIASIDDSAERATSSRGMTGNLEVASPVPVEESRRSGSAPSGGYRFGEELDLDALGVEGADDQHDKASSVSAFGRSNGIATVVAAHRCHRTLLAPTPSRQV